MRAPVLAGSLRSVVGVDVVLATCAVPASAGIDVAGAAATPRPCFRVYAA